VGWGSLANWLLSGNRLDEVIQRRLRLVLGWVSGNRRRRVCVGVIAYRQSGVQCCIALPRTRVMSL